MEIDYKNMTIEARRCLAQTEVNKAVVEVAAVGAIPIPFSDSILMTTIQIKMISSITEIFGINISKNLIKVLATSILSFGGASIAGKTVVTNILKFIPGAGTVVGGVISAGTGGIITKALGNTYISIMERISRGEMSIDELGTAKSKDAMSQLFIGYLKEGKIE